MHMPAPRSMASEFAMGDTTAKSAPSASAGATDAVHDVLRSPGQPLDSSTRAFMEPRFGRGFGDVRVHTGAAAAASAQNLDARAYTVGQNVVLGEATSLGSAEGRHVMAHELAHVAQASSFGSASAMIAMRAPKTPKVKVAPEPPGWLGPLRSSATHVKGDIWDVKIPSLGGDTWVGPYDQLNRYLKAQGLSSTMQAAHIVGGEHLLDIGSGLPYEKGPCVAIVKAHHSTWTDATTANQNYLAGRSGPKTGRTSVTKAEVKKLYDAVYSDHPEVAEMARNIVDLPNKAEIRAIMADTTSRNMPEPLPPPMDAHETPNMSKASPMDAHSPPWMSKAPSPMDAYSPPSMSRSPSPMDALSPPSMTKVSSPMDAFSPAPMTSEPALPVKTASQVLEEMGLARYPGDQEGPLVGRFRDGASISLATQIVTSGVTALSLATNKDISLLGLVQWHFDSAVDDAAKDLEKTFPPASALWNDASVDRVARNYEAAIGAITGRKKMLDLALIMAAFSPEKDVPAAVEAAFRRFGQIGVGEGVWQNYLDAADAYTDSLSIVQERLGDATWDTLPKAAADIRKRAEVLLEAGDNLDDTFYRLEFSIGIYNMMTYYALFDLHHVASVLQDLGRRVSGLASTIEGRAVEYHQMWNRIDEATKRISLTTKQLAFRFHQKLPDVY
jgi:hypothetical protein